jgi:hypothetical protein
MVTNVRLRFLLLALMVAASHIALVSHVTAHFQPSLEQCELCVSQAQPLAAIPAAEPEACVPVAAATGPGPVADRSIPVSPARPWFPRAPPATSS